jgi:hypothetical protein
MFTIFTIVTIFTIFTTVIIFTIVTTFTIFTLGTIFSILTIFTMCPFHYCVGGFSCKLLKMSENYQFFDIYIYIYVL